VLTAAGLGYMAPMCHQVIGRWTAK